MAITIIEEVARKLGGESVIGTAVRSQAELALAVRNRLPLATLKGLSRAGISEQEIERLVSGRWAEYGLKGREERGQGTGER